MHGFVSSGGMMPLEAAIPGRRASAIMPAALSAVLNRKKDCIEIELDEPEDHRPVNSYTTLQQPINSYTTLDRINGKANIKFDRDTEFDRIIVTFEGITNTFVEKVATTAPTTGRQLGRHSFLKLVQPVPAGILPQDGVGRAGETYTIPFNFVVPEKLLPQSCTHTTNTRHGATDPTQDEHLCMPPSFGDAMLASDAQNMLNDMAPEMSKVQYMIRVIVKKSPFAPKNKVNDLADKTLKVRVIPEREEQPPLTVPEDSEDYQLRKEKDVKKGLFKLGRIGRIVAEAAQPRAFLLPAVTKPSDAPVSTITHVNLRFDPMGPSMTPPPLGTLSTKLRVQTYFGTSAWRAIPSKKLLNAWDVNRGSYAESVELSSRNLSTVQWKKHTPDDNSGTQDARRASTLTGEHSTVGPSNAYLDTLPYYTASIILPISLPFTSRRSFAPTFHTCLVSHLYILDLNLSYHSPGTSVSMPSLNLRLPVQIASAGNPDARPSISEEEMAAINARMVAGEADDAWMLRRMTVAGYAGEGDDLRQEASPEYTLFATRSPLPRGSYDSPQAPRPVQQGRLSSGSENDSPTEQVQQRSPANENGPPGYHDIAGMQAFRTMRVETPGVTFNLPNMQRHGSGSPSGGVGAPVAA